MELHLDQIARALDLPPQKVERWIRQGRIPLVRHGGVCTFHREALEKWASEHNLSFRLDAAPSPGGEALPPSLRDAMAEGGVYTEVPGCTLQEVLRSGVGVLPFLDDEDRALLLERLLEREQLTSTGIGKGVAIPHSRDPLPDRMTQPRIATLFLDRPVDYRSLDDQPVFVLFMLLCPSVKVHLHLLSRLSFCLRIDAFISFLRSGPSRDALLQQVADLEAQLDPASPRR